MCMKEQKQEKNQNKNLYNKVLLCTMISVAVVAVISLVSIVYLCSISGPTSGGKMEAVLLDTGLSIIGIAISIWAGLNIINALEKKDIEEVQDTLKNTKAKVDKLSENVEEIEIVKNEQGDIYKGFFLQELLKTNYDVMSRYFYKLFSDCKDISTAEYVKLVLIEQYFSQVYLQYGEKSSLKSLVFSRAYDGIKLIDEVYEQYKKKGDLLLERYLLFRKYEFTFLMGYMRVGVPKFDSFIYAANGFAQISNKFGVELPEVDGDQDDWEYTGEDDNLEIAVYFVNTIGEAYSKIIEDKGLIGKRSQKEKITQEMMKNFAEKAVKYLEITVKWNQSIGTREVYYRNLGCAYERMDRLFGQIGSHAKEIISNYKKSFLIVISNNEEKMDRIQKIYHTLLSYYERYMRIYFRLDKKAIFKEKKNFIDFLEKIEGCVEIEIKEYLVHYQQASEIAMMDNARFSLQKSLNGFAWTWILVFLLNNDKYIKEKYVEAEDVYMKKIRNIINVLDAMGINDTYSQELKERYEIIEEYLNNR